MAASARPFGGRLAFPSLLIARAIYAFNWYDVGPIQPGLARVFSTPVGNLSFALWGFLFAVGLFQIPAGLLSLRTSPRTVSILGALVMGVGATLSAFVGNLWAFVALRFVVGVGAALFFSPAMALLTEYYEGERRGLAFGLFNGAFSAGAALAVFTIPVLAAATSDELALLLGGLLMLAAAVESWWALPATPRSEGAPAVRSAPEGSSVLRSPLLWVLAISLLGFWSANFAVPQFFESYAVQARGYSLAQSGGLDAVFILTALLGSPLGGYFASRTVHGRRLLALGALGVALSIGALEFLPSWAFGIDAFFFGVLSGFLFAALYLLPTRYREFDRRTAALSLGLINGVQVLAGSFMVLAGGYFFFGTSDFFGLWVFFALVCAVPLGALAWARRVEPRGQTFL